MTRRVPAVIVMVFVGLFMMCPSVYAADSPAKKPQVQLEVRIIKAKKHTDKNTKPPQDPRLKDVAPRIKQLFGFDCFSLETTKEAKTTLDAMAIFSLPIDRDLMVKVSQKPDARLVVDLAIKDLLATDYKVVSGGVLLIGGMKLEDGVMVVAIRATLK